MKSMRHSDTTRGKELKMKVMREMLSRLINLFIQTLWREGFSFSTRVAIPPGERRLPCRVAIPPGERQHGND
eukprot:scaffold23629_cov117-Skeletonema_marinoi.AAC.1